MVVVEKIREFEVGLFLGESRDTVRGVGNGHGGDAEEVKGFLGDLWGCGGG